MTKAYMVIDGTIRDTGDDLKSLVDKGQKIAQNNQNTKEVKVIRNKDRKVFFYWHNPNF